MRYHLCRLLNLGEGLDLGSVSIRATHLIGMGVRARAASFRWSLFLVSMWS